MDQYTGSERRRQARLKHTLQVKYRIKSVGGPLQATEIADLSTGGLKVFFVGNVREQDVVELELLLAGSAIPLKATATLKWISAIPVAGKYPGGLEFVNLPDEHRARLEKFIAKHLPPEPTP